MKEVIVEFEKIKNPFSGLGQYCQSLLNEWRKSSTFRPTLLLPKKYFFTSNYPDKNLLLKVAKRFPILIPSSNVVHLIHQDSDYLPYRYKHLILTIHDLNYVLESTDESFKRNYLSKLQNKINKCSALVYISNFTKNCVHQFLDIPEGVVELVNYNGVVSLSTTQIRPALLKFESKSFFFSIGTVLSKKNFHTLVSLANFNKNFKFVIAGEDSFSYARQMKEEISKLNLDENFQFLGPISDEEKSWCYHNAKAFIFPSLYEGFGLPIVEAMSVGLPIFSSDKTSLPEIGGEDVFYFSNFSPEHMNDVITTGLKTFDQARSQRLINRSKEFTFFQTAQKYNDLYKKFLNN